MFHTDDRKVSPAGQFHWWSEPLYGYYNSSDEWVIRRHMELLTQAGVDFLVFDVTNCFTYQSVAEKVMKVINFIENSRTWKDRIVQIHVSNGGELMMIPREGKERFIFGQPEHIEEKFAKMEKYYSAIAFRKGQDHYSIVNVEYKGQIVCK